MDNSYEEFFYSEDPQEIEKEKKKRSALHSLFPNLMGGKNDKTNYVLQKENKPKEDIINSSKNNHNNFDWKIESDSSKNNIKNTITTEINKKSYNFDPWKREKEIDSLNLYNQNKKERYDKDEFEYINKSKFNSVIDNSFDFEGGYSNNRYDRGGETNYGITNIFMEQYKKALPDGKVKPIKEITKEDAYRMYNAMWNQHNLGYIKDKGIATLLNDYMINSNEWKVAKRVQDILNQKGHSIKVDGLFGTKTLEAINNTDKEWLIEEILIDRYNNYREQVKYRPTQETFYKGWINRLNKIAEIVGSKLRFPTEY